MKSPRLLSPFRPERYNAWHDSLKVLKVMNDVPQFDARRFVDAIMVLKVLIKEDVKKSTPDNAIDILLSLLGFKDLDDMHTNWSAKTNQTIDYLKSPHGKTIYKALKAKMK